MAVITVSREYGTDGEQIAQQVAEGLGYSYFDKELLADVARAANATEEQVSRYDEKEVHGLRRFLTKLFVPIHPRTIFPDYYHPGLPLEWSLEPIEMYPAGERRSTLNPDEIMAFFRDVVEKVCRRGNVVIVGRGSSQILAGQPDVFHIRFVAPVADRVKYVVAHEELTEADALRKVEAIDKQRAQYLKNHYNANWAHARHYHLVLNTSFMRAHQAAKVIITAVQQMNVETDA